jgi:hypothetical protein
VLWTWIEDEDNPVVKETSKGNKMQPRHRGTQYLVVTHQASGLFAFTVDTSIDIRYRDALIPECPEDEGA